MSLVKAYRGSILHFLRAPADRHDAKCYEYLSDGLMIVENGKVQQVGQYTELKKSLLPDTLIVDYSGYLLMPGFIDTHIHYPQTEVIASYGEQLLEWLNAYVFPTEEKFDSLEHAEKVAKFFVQELLRNGTTSCVAYSTVHLGSANSLFRAAKDLNMCMLTGKTLMDRNAPTALCDTATLAYEESKKLIELWHKQGRANYVVTPRFAPTSTEAQLEVTTALLKEFPDTYLQTHISENRNEVAWVRELYPWSKDYTDIYDHYGFLGPRSLLGHAVHISDREFDRLAATNTAIVWCPTSNFFLGSGLFKLNKAREYQNRLAIATDVGGGSSFSMLQTLNEAYKVAALQGSQFSPLESFYHITLGNAEAISLAHAIGNFKPQSYADFVVIDLNSTPLLSIKTRNANTLEEVLFDLSILGDDRAIKATFIAGELRHERPEQVYGAMEILPDMQLRVGT